MRVQWVEVEEEGEEALMNALLGILRAYPQLPLPTSEPLPLPPTVIFVPTRTSCQRTASFLKSNGIAAAALHGGSSLQQALDDQVLMQRRALSCIGRNFFTRTRKLREPSLLDSCYGCYESWP
jgi:superfamily II DNA/RNA helicase